MRLGLGLGLTLVGGGAGPWYGGALDMRFDTGQFYWDGTTYPSEAEMLVAAGGVRAGAVVTFPPKDVGANLVTNPTMTGTYPAPAATGNPDGWIPSPAYSANVSLSIGSGVMSQQSPGTGLARWCMPFTTSAGKAYRSKISQTDFGTKSGAIQASSNSNLGGSQNATAFPIGVTPSTPENFFAAIINGTMFWGVAISGTTALRTYDNAELYEVTPLVNWNTAGRAVVIEFVTPSVGGTKRVLWQADATNDQNRQRIEWDASNNLRFISTYNNAEQANLNFGVVAPSTPGVILASMATNRMIGRLNSNASLEDSTATLAGVTHMRLGESFTGEAWADGTITRFTLYEHELLPSDALFMSGDSYMGIGAGGVSLPITAEAAGKAVWNNTLSSGGWTLAQITAEVQANTDVFQDAILIIWDGNGVNGFVDVATSMALYGDIAATKPDGRFLFISPLKRANLSTQENLNMGALQAAMLAAWPNNYVDAQACLAANATSPGDDPYVAAGQVPISLLQGDGSHLTSAGMTDVWSQASIGVNAKIATL